ncbi:MAG: aminoacetone oxidase family FAD-binding enzyme [Clostridia bacterium]|nr:aminoacetone oxidase family FAD-binding enzyme [Clostridia bacterium]
MRDIIIVGGGASAFATALSAKAGNPNLDILIVEKNEQLGKKLKATGNGRCNITNSNAEEFRLVLRFLEQNGILTKEEDEGRFYPYNEDAADCVKALSHRIKALGVDTSLGDGVIKIDKDSNGFTVNTEQGQKLEAKNVVIACGGKAGPQYGTIGDSFKFARSLGHRVTSLAPALTGIDTVEDLKALKGVRHQATASLYKEGQLIASEQGQVQFTEYGLSGICIFNLSRLIKFEEGEDVREGFQKFTISLDLLPELDHDQVVEILEERLSMADMKLQDALRTLVKEPLANYLLGKATDLNMLAKELKDLKLGVSGLEGWKMAQLTRGGVVLDEINMDTMESKLVKGLYIVGEAIDFDGPCGGYNLQNAFETGIYAGEALAGE